ncbi:hypothetical protein HOLleu_39775 [Holothuria leucospilota]|uniref:Uncharacterized protein n=1 Tax=Holothuria leucospilota TaxID=206669 RepID=A0A9Q1BCA8_HOLLE|nr:hypothetical protein HOLleu_39775 [Holothuria leucospilota]
MEPSVWKTIQSSLPGVSKKVAYRSSSLPVSAAKPVSSLGVRPYPMKTKSKFCSKSKSLTTTENLLSGSPLKIHARIVLSL